MKDFAHWFWTWPWIIWGLFSAATTHALAAARRELVFFLFIVVNTAFAAAMIYFNLP